LLDSIFGFFANNISVLIFLIAVIAPIIGKSLSGQGKGQGTPARPLRPMPTFGGGPGKGKPDPYSSSPREREEDTGTGRLGQEPDGWPRTEEVSYQPIQDLKPNAATAALGGGERQTQPRKSSGLGLPARSPSSPVQTPQASQAAWSPDQEDLTKAVVWAEILGPPRSKRPLRK
jgi:hypothetical protein